MRRRLLATGIVIMFPVIVAAQGVAPAPDRRTDEGAGPFETLVIQGGMLIDGTGGPPAGPVNIVIKGNRIESIGRGDADSADHVVDATGMYILPGFVDMHAHCGGAGKAPEAEYVHKLWLAHGVTTVRGVPLGPNDWTVKEKERSAANEIVAPRIFNYQRPPRDLKTAEEARQWVQQAPLRGIDGLKLGSYRPEIMAAILDEARRHQLGSTAHLGQEGVAQMNAIDAARLGLDTVTHFYGHFESLLADHTVQPWPPDQNQYDEQHRFGQVARLWDKIHEPGSPEWKAYLAEHLELGTVFDPTMCIYSAGRDVMRARTAEWHDTYTLPSLMNFYQPSRRSHGSYWFYWTTWDEVAWRNFYRVWMQLINDYKKMGGRVTVGSDSGFIYDTYGFGYIEELELLQEAGFHPLEVIQCATRNGALTLHEPRSEPIQFGEVRPGLLADLVVIDANPLENLKVLYATGAEKLDDATGEVTRVGGVKWTVKDGIVYDAQKLLADVRAMVQEQKSRVVRSSPADAGATPTVPASTKSAGSAADRAADSAAASVATAGDAAAPAATRANGAAAPRVLAGESVVVALNAESTSVWAYSAAAGTWIKAPTGDPAGTLEPVVSAHVAVVRLGERVLAFSGLTGQWTDLLLEAPAAEAEVTVDAERAIVRSGNRVSVFNAQSGTWSSVELMQ